MSWEGMREEIVFRVNRVPTLGGKLAPGASRQGFRWLQRAVGTVDPLYSWVAASTWVMG